MGGSCPGTGRQGCCDGSQARDPGCARRHVRRRSPADSARRHRPRCRLRRGEESRRCASSPTSRRSRSRPGTTSHAWRRGTSGSPSRSRPMGHSKRLRASCGLRTPPGSPGGSSSFSGLQRRFDAWHPSPNPSGRASNTRSTGSARKLQKGSIREAPRKTHSHSAERRSRLQCTPSLSAPAPRASSPPPRWLFLADLPPARPVPTG